MHFALLYGDLHMSATAAFAWLMSAWESCAQSLGSALVTSLWQGAAIVCGIEIAMRIMPRVSAVHRFSAWAAGFALAAAMPLFPLLHFGHAVVTNWGMESTLPGRSSAAVLRLDARWGLAIAALWVVGSLIRAVDLGAHSLRLRRLWKTARPAEVSATLLAAIHDLRGGRVLICTTQKLDRPSVIGFLAPRILIPDWLIARLTPAELEQIVLHEGEHLRRRDDWSNLLQKLCLVIFPLNPALAWIEHRLCREREMACDEGVVRITNAPRAYAACLASLAERGLERRAEALSLGAWQRRSELVHRVHQILLRKHRLSRTSTTALLGTLGCLLIAGSVEMTRCPQLVVFVPRQNNLAMTAERQKQLAALLASENTESKMVLPPSFHALQTRAVLPSPQQSIPVSSFKHVTRNAPTRTSERRRTPHTEQIANNEQSGDRLNRDPNQQWVVLAALEEVETVSRSPGSVADYNPSAEAVDQTEPSILPTTSAARTAKGKGAGKGQSGGSPNAGGMENQYTITRLLLRVVPANHGSAQPASVRGGWLIFQL